MAFGNASLPTRKYVYGARETIPGVSTDQGKPVRFAGHDLAVEQLFKAHRLQNRLVEIELARRTRANEIVHNHSPALAQLLTDAETLSTEVEGLRTELKRRNAAARSKNADREFAAQVRTRAAALSVAWKAHKTLKDTTYADPTVRGALDSNDATAVSANDLARTEAVADGLYWGTSLIVMQRVKRSGPPPRFKRWEGEGLIAVQFQRKADKTSARVPVLDSQGNPRIHPRSGKPAMRNEEGSSLRTADSHLRNFLCWIQPVVGHAKHVTVHFRIGSNPNGEPVWVALPTVMHRPLSEGAQIKWAYLSRRKIGTHYKWEVQFDIAMSNDAWTIHDGIRDAKKDRVPSETGTVAVALGWRKIGDEIRVAAWVGDDGQEGEFIIPADRVKSWLQCDDLQGIRGTMFDSQKEILRDWLKQQVLPQVWKDRTQSLAAWRSGARLASLVIWWHKNRLPNDGAILRQMEGELVKGGNGAHDHYTGGRKQDKHLLDWEANRRVKCQNWRKHEYREFALALRKQYKNVVIAEIDWHAIAEKPAPEKLVQEVNKRFRGIAACASLRDQLTDLMTEVTVPAPGITITCNVCGGTCEQPVRSQWLQCEQCGGKIMDRAFNAAKNLLARGLGFVSPQRPARVL